MNSHQIFLSKELNPDKCLQRVAFLADATGNIPVIENVNTLTQRLSSFTNNVEYKKLFKKYIKQHLATTYKDRDKLKHYLSIIIDHLSKHPNDREGVIEKLIEGIPNCTPGFQDRAYVVMCGIYEANTLDQLLAILRRSIVERIYCLGESKESTDGEVHTHHRYFVVALNMGYAIYGDKSSDPYQGLKSDQVIAAELAKGFQDLYTTPAILESIWNESPLSKLGYVGKKAEGTSYEVRVYDPVIAFFKAILQNPNLTLADCFEIDENSLIRDINWLKINSLLLSYLYQNQYIKSLENAVGYEFSESGQRLHLSFPRGNIGAGRVTWQLMQDGKQETYHLLLGATKRKEDFKHIPYPLLRQLLKFLLSGPSIPTKILSLIEQLVDDNDVELNQQINGIILRGINSQIFNNMIEKISLPRLRAVLVKNQAMMQAQVAAIPLQSNFLTFEDSEKCAFVASLFSDRLRTLLIIPGVVSIDTIASLIRNLSSSGAEAVCQEVFPELEKAIQTQEEATFILMNLPLNISRAMCKLFDRKIQSCFPSLAKIVAVIKLFKDFSAQHNIREDLVESRLNLVYRTLKVKILSYLEQQKNLPIEEQRKNIYELLALLPSSAQGEFINDIKEYLPVLLIEWSDLQEITQSLNSESALNALFVEVKKHPACCLRQKPLTSNDFRQFCGLSSNVVTESFCEVFAENILTSFEGPNALGLGIISGLPDEKLSIFCRTLKTFFPLILKDESIFTFLGRARIKLILEALDEDLKCLVTSPASVRMFAKIYKPGILSLLKAGLKNACTDKIRTLKDLRDWYAVIETPDHARVLYMMVNDYLLNDEAPLLNLPQDLFTLLKGNKADLWIANAIMKKMSGKNLQAVIKSFTPEITQSIADIEKLTILLCDFDKKDALAFLSAVGNMSCNYNTDLNKLMNLLEEKPLEIKKLILAKVKDNLVNSVTSVKALPNICRHRDVKDVNESLGLVFAIVKEKIIGLIATIDDLVALSERFHSRFYLELFTPKSKEVAKKIRHWREFKKMANTFICFDDEVQEKAMTEALNELSEMEFNYAQDLSDFVDFIKNKTKPFQKLVISKIKPVLLRSLTRLDFIPRYVDFVNINFTTAHDGIFKVVKVKIAELVNSIDDLKSLFARLPSRHYRELFGLYKEKIAKKIQNWNDLVRVTAILTPAQKVELLDLLKNDKSSPLHALNIDEVTYSLIELHDLMDLAPYYFPLNFIRRPDYFNALSDKTRFTTLMQVEEVKTAFLQTQYSFSQFVDFMLQLTQVNQYWMLENYNSKIHSFIAKGDDLALFARTFTENLNLNVPSIISEYFKNRISNTDMLSQYLFNTSKANLLYILDLILNSIGENADALLKNKEGLINILFYYKFNDLDLVPGVIELFRKYGGEVTVEDLEAAPVSKRRKQGNAVVVANPQSAAVSHTSSTSIADGVLPTVDQTPVAAATFTSTDSSLLLNVPNNAFAALPAGILDPFFDEDPLPPFSGHFGSSATLFRPPSPAFQTGENFGSDLGKLNEDPDADVDDKNPFFTLPDPKRHRK